MRETESCGRLAKKLWESGEKRGMNLREKRLDISCLNMYTGRKELQRTEK